MSIDFYSKIEYNLENRSNKEGRRIQKIRDNDRQSAHGKENEEVKKYIEQLPVGMKKEIFEMVYLDGMTQKEAGESLGYTQARVSQVMKDL